MKKNRRNDTNTKTPKTDREYGKEKDLITQYYWQIFLIVTLLAILLRFSLLLGLPQDLFYPSDHLYFWGWSRNSVENGLFKSYGYNRPNLTYTYGKPFSVQVRETVQGPDGKIYYPGDIVTIPARVWTNIQIIYPPLTASIMYIQGLIQRSLDPSVEPFTLLSWLILEIPNYIFDCLLALGCMFIVREWRGKRWGMIAYVLILFCPGILLGGILWGQKDAWFMAAEIWCVYFCMKERWVLSGILLGCALMIKGQSIFMIPALAYFFFTRRSLKPFLIHISVASAIIMLMALPFMCQSGWAWFDNSYLFNFTGRAFQYTTLEGLNIWMLDLVLRSRDTNIYSTIFAVTKKTWSEFFVLGALIVSIVACRRRYGYHKLALPMLLALTFSTTFLFSVKVCERYSYYSLPFLAISACIEGRFWGIFTGFSIIALFEMTNRVSLPSCLHLEGASFNGLVLLTVLSFISLFLFVYWLVEVWRSRSEFTDTGRADNLCIKK